MDDPHFGQVKVSFVMEDCRNHKSSQLLADITP